MTALNGEEISWSVSNVMETAVNGRREANPEMLANVSNCFGVEIQKRYHSKYYQTAVSEEGNHLGDVFGKPQINQHGPKATKPRRK